MAIVDVKRLAHVGIKVKDVETEANFYREFVGLGETARDDNGRVYLRCNADFHSLTLNPAHETGLDHYALQVSNVEKAAASLSQAGIAYQESNAELGQGPAIRLTDPDGFVIELIDQIEQVSPVYGPRAVQPRRLGHITLLVDDPQTSVDFYTNVLGFRVSDWFENAFAWLRCNPDHHSVAVAKLGRVGLHHFAFDVLNFSELERQADHLARNGRSYIYGPGRHGPGHNQFSYFRDLDEHIIEFTCDSQQIWDEENHQPRVWRATEKWVNLWGQEPPEEFLQ